VEGKDTEVEVENPETGGRRTGTARKVLNMKNRSIFLMERLERFIIIIKFDKKMNQGG